jgi:hypothetical protein
MRQIRWFPYVSRSVFERQQQLINAVKRQRNLGLNRSYKIVIKLSFPLGMCYTPLQHDFALDPIIPPFDFHFRIYKRDLVILTE